MNIFSLDNYVSVITGGASGLGEAIAIGLASFGSHIVLLDMNTDGLNRVKKRIEALDRKCEVFVVDVTNWELITEARERTKEIFGYVDVLVNCAGMNIRKPVLEMQPAEFRKIVDIDLTGTFLCSKAFGEMMVERKSGSIINLASINAHIAMEKQAGYASSKGGIVQLTKVLALEWAKYNVRINALSPAHHKTPLVTELVKDAAWYNDLVSRIPLGRFGEAYEIIGPAVFLASKASSFMTGISLLTDGGWTAI
ncbi:MAG: 2-deoxy-D-gluconate 3-dehydrogenase [Firmicutes bacterium HGW-Firmicutes-12]|nr:MAG: 2-deoxy-D-gluconate 3-dehydrogenase [Firmicutes bacterium HGW-Firmicutes-12]